MQAQNASFAWVKQYAGSQDTYGNAVTYDAAGNVYTTGRTGSNVFIFKQDASGNFLWAKQFTGTYMISYSIAVDIAGNVLVTGFFQNTVDFDPGPTVYNLTVSGGSNIFISKLDMNGNFVWAKKMDGLANVFTSGFGISTDALGNVYTTGQFDFKTDFDPGPGIFNLTPVGLEDVFISKLDAGGNFMWAKQLGGPADEVATSIVLDATGNIYLTGYFQDMADFDPGAATFFLTSSGFDDIFVTKFDNSGNLLWADQMGGTADDFSTAVATDNTGNVFLTGYFYGTADFDPGPAVYSLSSAGNADIFISKLDAGGNFLWAKQMGDTLFDRGLGISLDVLGNVYTTGAFNGTVDFDPGSGVYNFSSNGNVDIFFSKLNSGGGFIWAKRVGGPNSDIANAIKVDPSGNIYSTGFFRGVVDFDPGAPVFNLTSNVVTAAFIHKMQPCFNSTSTINAVVCYSYNLNGQIYTSSGTYEQTILNATGCDSLITLQLTVNGSITNNVATACDTYTWQGQTYTSSGHYTVSYPAPGGCEFIFNLDLTINNSIATTVNAAICDGQNYAGHTTPGTYVDHYFTVNGCDSIRTLNLTVKPRSFSNVSATICEGQSYLGHTTQGTFVDILTAANGCDSLRTLDLTVNPRAFTTFNIFICEGKTYLAGGAYQTTTGTYYDTLHTTLGCDSIIITNLLVFPNPKPDLGPDRNLCTSTSVAAISPGTYSSYLWQDNSTQPNFMVGSIGKYWVTVTDINNCKAADTVTILAIDTIPRNFLPADQELCYGNVLKINVPGYRSYLWNTGSVFSAISISDFGKFYLTVTDDHHCTGTDTIFLWRKDCIPIGIPNAFTPNGDAKNDIFKPTIFQALRSFSFAIFNRYGQKLFETRNYGTGWDGSFKGKDQPAGTYVYRIVFTNIFGYESENNGTVLLLR